MEEQINEREEREERKEREEMGEREEREFENGAETQLLLSQKEKELAEAADKFLRLHADFDNFRKRMGKEKEEWYRYASQGIVEKLLPMIDNFDRALAAIEQGNPEVRNVFSGVVMIHRQLVDILQGEGLEALEAVGKEFDPLQQEAMQLVQAEEGQEDNQVVEELRKGYRFKDKIIRPTLVKVAKKSEDLKEE